MFICRKRASRCPIFLLGRMPMPNDGSHSTFSSNAISVPGNRQTATCGSPTAAKPRVMEFLNLVVTSLSSIWAGRVATWCKLWSHIEGTPFGRHASERGQGTLEGVPDNKLDEVPNALGWRLGRSNSAILPGESRGKKRQWGFEA